MTEHCYCGIDVAKERLDVEVLPHRQRFSVDNNATGWAELVERLHALPIAAIAKLRNRAISSAQPAASLRTENLCCSGSTMTSRRCFDTSTPQNLSLIHI